MPYVVDATGDAILSYAELFHLICDYRRHRPSNLIPFQPHHDPGQISVSPDRRHMQYGVTRYPFAVSLLVLVSLVDFGTEDLASQR